MRHPDPRLATSSYLSLPAAHSRHQRCTRRESIVLGHKCCDKGRHRTTLQTHVLHAMHAQQRPSVVRSHTASGPRPGFPTGSAFPGDAPGECTFAKILGVVGRYGLRPPLRWRRPPGVRPRVSALTEPSLFSLRSPAPQLPFPSASGAWVCSHGPHFAGNKDRRRLNTPA